MRYILFILFTLFSAPLLADGDIHDLFRKIWSPYCKGISLQECTSSQAQELRDDLTARVKAGETPDQILADLETQYGDKLRMMPDRGGRENLAWQLPWVFAGIIILTILGLALRRKRPSFASPLEGFPAPSKIDAAVQDKILNDLKNRL